MTYQHILLATDLTATQQPVIHKAGALANACQAKISIVHVVEPLPCYASGYAGVVELEDSIRQEAESELVDIASSLNIAADNQHVLVGSPKFMILDVAKQIKADLIVIGSNGHHGLGRIIASTAEALSHTNACDILLVHLNKG